MTTITVDAPGEVALTAPGYVLVEGFDVLVGLPAPAAPWPSGSRDQLIVCEGGKTNPRRLVELAGAVVEKPSWVLNGVGRMGFTISAFDPALLEGLVDPDTIDLGVGELALLGREVQWWRDGECRWAGIPVSADVSLDGTVTFDCFDLGWYFTRRFLGAAERQDRLDDKGQMELAGLPGWTADGTTMTRSSTHKVRGTYSMRLAGAGAAQFTFLHPAMTTGQDLTVLATVECRAGAADPDDAAVVTIQAVPVGSTDVYRPDAGNTARLTSDSPRSGWDRYTARCIMRPSVAHLVTVTLWNVGGGDRFFDDVRALQNDTTGSGATPSDLSEHVAAIVRTAQAASRGKSDLGISWVTYPTGVEETYGFRHLEHTQISDLIKLYTDRDDGIDWWIHPYTREFFIAPRKGQDRTEPLGSWLVAGGGWAHDESDRATSVVVIGDGDGIERPEGGYIDASSTGGIVLDELVHPPNGTPLSALDPIAKQTHASKSKPQVSYDPITVPGDWWGDRCEVGDWFPPEFTTGVLRPPTGDGFRVAEITHDLEADRLELV